MDNYPIAQISLVEGIHNKDVHLGFNQNPLLSVF